MVFDFFRTFLGGTNSQFASFMCPDENWPRVQAQADTHFRLLDTLGVEQIPAGLRRGFYLSVRESIQ